MEKGFLSGSVVKNPPASAGDASSIPGSGRSPGKGSSTPIFLSGKSHGQRSLEGYSPWGHKSIFHTSNGKFNSNDHYIYYHGQESLRINGVVLIVNKRVRNAVLGCNLKNDRMISIHFQGKTFNITVIQVYAPISNAEEAEVEWFYEDLQDLLEQTQKKMSFSL